MRPVRLRKEEGVAGDGTFAIEMFPTAPAPDDPWILVRAEGRAPVALSPDDDQRKALAGSGALGGLRVVLRHAGTVEGLVRAPDGTPLAGARVGFTRDPFAREPDDDQAVTTTDAEGRYRLTEADLRTPPYFVVQSATSWMRPAPLACGLSPERTKTVDVDMVEGSEAQVEIRLPGPSEGWLLDLDGGFAARITDDLLRDVRTATGPHRLKVLDADGKVKFERAFEIPPRARAFAVPLGE